ncbi:hypothetical protein [Streptomyces sp. NBC_01477]|uniref:hypothetical protein n=1 Tax=Streptomyces sp. NBC_01477 TaxID=2976015 RepID=UPI002E2F11C7|nr:hypothetical protein [Streptomyces sp. NBC_01477]
MTKSDNETHTSHAPGSQPSVRPGSDEPQTITAPTPPVAWSSGPPDQADLADGSDTPEPRRHGEEPETTSQDD